MKTIIAGSLSITDRGALEQAIAAARDKGIEVTEVLCGGAPGVDTLGYHWARGHFVPVEIYAANWKRWGKRAGPMRNARMVRDADAAIFVWDGVSRGTADCINQAEHKGIPYLVYLTEGYGCEGRSDFHAARD